MVFYPPDVGRQTGRIQTETKRERDRQRELEVKKYREINQKKVKEKGKAR